MIILILCLSSLYVFVSFLLFFSCLLVFKNISFFQHLRLYKEKRKDTKARFCVAPNLIVFYILGTRINNLLPLSLFSTFIIPSPHSLRKGHTFSLHIELAAFSFADVVFFFFFFSSCLSRPSSTKFNRGLWHSNWVYICVVCAQVLCISVVIIHSLFVVVVIYLNSLLFLFLIFNFFLFVSLSLSLPFIDLYN